MAITNVKTNSASNNTSVQKASIKQKIVAKKSTLQDIEDDVDFSEFTGKILHIKVGDAKMQAEEIQAEIDRIDSYLKELVMTNNIRCLVLTTPYHVDIKLIESTSKKDKEGEL